jgi:hypothetical protein
MIEASALPEAGFGTTARFVICWHERADPELMSDVGGKAECAGRPARSRWCKSITMKE